MYKVLIPEDISQVGKDYLLEKGYEVILGTGSDIDTIKKEIVDVDAVIARTALYPKEVIEAGKRLKIIARYGVGTDNIDVAAAEELGIYVTIGLGENVRSVAEHTMTLLLSCAKNIVLCHEKTKKGNWEIRNSKLGNEVYGKTLGLIGVGAIGKSTANIAKNGFGMRVIGYDAYAPKDSIPEYITMFDNPDDVYQNSDFVSLHIPLTPETKNMVDKNILKKMKKNAILLNCSRGGIVDESHLYDALRNGEIAGAALDVFDTEPIDVNNSLLTLENFIASPHYAGMTVEATDGLSLSAAKAIDDVLNGNEPDYPINNPKGL